ncbi:MAG: hypothetical protein RL557_566 [archaeon]|jgi:stage II sporulation protein M
MMVSKKRVIKRSDNFVYRNFKQSLIDLKKIKLYFLFSVLLFVFVGMIGLAFPVFFEEEVYNLIRELIGKTDGLGLFGLIQFIIYNNTTTSFVGMLAGVLLGIPPLFVLIINAYIIGFVANKSIAVEGITILWRLFPHGVFELPAVLLSLSVGIRIGYSLMHRCLKWYNKKLNDGVVFLLILVSWIFFPISLILYWIFTLINKNLRKQFYATLVESLRIFVFIVVPLLVIAGIIEGVLIVVVG